MLVAIVASGDSDLERALPPAFRIQGEVRARLCRDGLLVTDERVRDMADAARYPLQPNELAFHRQLNGGGAVALWLPCSVTAVPRACASARMHQRLAAAIGCTLHS